MAAMPPCGQVGCNRPLRDMKKVASCSRLWNSLSRLSIRDRSSSFKNIHLPKWKQKCSPFHKRRNFSRNDPDLQSEKDSSGYCCRPVLYRRQDPVGTSKCGISTASCSKEGHIVVHMQDYASPYADFTGNASCSSLHVKLRRDSSISLDQNEGTSCSLMQKNVETPSLQIKPSVSFAEEECTSMTSAKFDLEQQIRKEIEN